METTTNPEPSDKNLRECPLLKTFVGKVRGFCDKPTFLHEGEAYPVFSRKGSLREFEELVEENGEKIILYRIENVDAHEYCFRYASLS